MHTKFDPILGDITARQLALIEDQLSHNGHASDEELQQFFIDHGMTEAQAKRALTYRTRYRRNTYALGASPILTGDDAICINPYTGSYEREGDNA